MNGVEILSSAEVVAARANWNWINFWITIGVVFVVAIIAGLIFALTEDDPVAFWVMFLVIFIIGGSIFGGLVGMNTGEPISYETHYKVTIDDSVSMNEFLDKYEIIDQEGKIYTVKERE